jgi:hypothetical protein
MNSPKADGTKWFPLTEGGPDSLPAYALPLPGAVILAVNNTAIYLPFMSLVGSPEAGGYHLQSTIIAVAQAATSIETSPPGKDEPCS